MQSQLGVDGNPVYAGPDGPGAITSAATFGQWFRDVPGVNQTTVLPLTLTETAPGSGIYQYLNGGFFPIDGQLGGNQGRTHNFRFTARLETTFTYRGGETFNFTGDDDIWVFLDDRLAVDLGGVHSLTSGSVSLDAFGLTVGRSYPFDMFSCERHTDGSACNLQTSIDLTANRQYRYPVRAVDADGDTLAYTKLAGPDGLAVDPGTGLVTWTPGSDQAGDHTVRVRVSDGRGGGAGVRADRRRPRPEPGPAVHLRPADPGHPRPALRLPCRRQRPER